MCVVSRELTSLNHTNIQQICVLFQQNRQASITQTFSRYVCCFNRIESLNHANIQQVCVLFQENRQASITQTFNRYVCCFNRINKPQSHNHSTVMYVVSTESTSLNHTNIQQICVLFQQNRQASITQTFNRHVCCFNRIDKPQSHKHQTGMCGVSAESTSLNHTNIQQVCVLFQQNQSASISQTSNGYVCCFNRIDKPQFHNHSTVMYVVSTESTSLNHTNIQQICVLFQQNRKASIT